MSAPSVQSDDFTIKNAFAAFYVVPDYQRDYVWESEQVEQLLTDVSAELGSTNPEDAAEYFIGSIVVCPRADGTLELIDGQQRMTTLFTIVCAIRDRLAALNQPPSEAHRALIAATDVDVRGETKYRYRLDLQYKDSGDVLVQIAERKPIAITSQSTRSVVNICGAYSTALSFLVQTYGEDAMRLREFFGYLINRVKLIRVQTENVAKALKIFETINDRGKGLDAMDLLKNLLFMKAQPTEFAELSYTWKKLQDVLYVAGEKPLRFLRYFIFASYDIDELREDEIYAWLVKNAASAGYASNPRAFAEGLVEAATAYAHFLKGKAADGSDNRFLANISLLGGKSAKQHLILLLAGRQLEPAMFDRLCAEVECLFFSYVITREPTRNFERNFARWANEIRKSTDSDTLNRLFEFAFRKEKLTLSARFDLAMQELTDESIQNYRLMYVLAKLVQSVELDAYGETEITRWLRNYVNGGYEIEHILATHANETAKREFGEGDLPKLIHQLGNLTLLEKSANSSIRNGPYSLKKGEYIKSNLLLTQLLAHRPSVGAATKVNKAVANLNAYAEWNANKLAIRQEELRKLARKVWRIPDVSLSPGTTDLQTSEGQSHSIATDSGQV